MVTACLSIRPDPNHSCIRRTYHHHEYVASSFQGLFHALSVAVVRLVTAAVLGLVGTGESLLIRGSYICKNNGHRMPALRTGRNIAGKAFSQGADGCGASCKESVVVTSNLLDARNQTYELSWKMLGHRGRSFGSPFLY